MIEFFTKLNSVKYFCIQYLHGKINRKTDFVQRRTMALYCFDWIAILEYILRAKWNVCKFKRTA